VGRLCRLGDLGLFNFFGLYCLLMIASALDMAEDGHGS
jgi:hypothetical protein